MYDRKLGIDDIATCVPELYLDAKDLAEARGLDPNYITKGLGIEKMSITDADEDAATMAAMAALKLMKKNNLEPEEIGFIHVATETGLDEAKPISCYIQGMLEQVYGPDSFEHIGAPETKFACVGATYALLDRLAFIKAGWNREKYAIVIATDIAKYDLKSKGERTQGAGAIALLTKNEPRLLAYEPESCSFSTKDDRDFFRPIGKDTAVFDGQYSIGCYLRDMRIAADQFKKNMISSEKITLSPGESLSDYFARISFHPPFPKMAKNAFASFLMHDWRDLPRWEKIIEQTGPEPNRGGLSGVDLYINKPYKDFRRKFVETEEFKREYDEKLKDSLEALKLIGNPYTGGVWMGVDSIFEMNKDDLTGKRFPIGSYGSGGGAIACSFIIQSGYSEVVKKFSLIEEWSKRRIISLEEYVQFHEGELGVDQCIVKPKNEFVLDHIGDGKKIEDYGYRYYKYIA